MVTRYEVAAKKIPNSVAHHAAVLNAVNNSLQAAGLRDPAVWDAVIDLLRDRRPVYEAWEGGLSDEIQLLIESVPNP